MDAASAAPWASVLEMTANDSDDDVAFSASSDISVGRIWPRAGVECAHGGHRLGLDNLVVVESDVGPVAFYGISPEDVTSQRDGAAQPRADLDVREAAVQMTFSRSISTPGRTDRT
jgi:hypothetical protein